LGTKVCGSKVRGMKVQGTKVLLGTKVSGTKVLFYWVDIKRNKNFEIKSQGDESFSALKIH
jgi:hypothetical protein